MTQEEQISRRIRWAKKMRETELQLLEYYARFLQGDDNAANDLIAGLDTIYLGKIRRYLSNAGCYDDETEHTALQEARLAAWKLLTECRAAGKADYPFVRACSGIYAHKAMDVVRAYSGDRKKSGIIQSLDDATGDGQDNASSGKPMGDSIPTQAGDGQDPGEMLIEKERKMLWADLQNLYLQSMLDSDTFPPSSLALYYARILPHLLHIQTDEESIPDTKASSPKWALNRMGQKNILQLGRDSEQELHHYVSDHLSWCEAFYRQMEDVTASSSGNMPIGSIIYTREYDSKKTGHWCDYMYKMVLQETCRRASADRLLLERMQTYLSRKDALIFHGKGGAAS